MATGGERRIESEVPSGTRTDAAGAVAAPVRGTVRNSTDPASSILTGYPGARVAHSGTGGQGPDDPAAGFLTGYPGTRTADHLHAGTDGLDDPVADVLTGYPGPRVPHSAVGAQSADDPAAGFLTGYPGARTARHVGTSARRTAPVDTAAEDADPETMGRRGHD